MGAEGEPLNGCGDTGRAEGGGEAGGAVGEGTGVRLVGDGSPHHAVLQGGGGDVATGKCPLPQSAATSAAAPAAARVDARPPAWVATRVAG